jgi:hypothetical protein
MDIQPSAVRMFLYLSGSLQATQKGICEFVHDFLRNFGIENLFLVSWQGASQGIRKTYLQPQGVYKFLVSAFSKMLDAKENTKTLGICLWVLRDYARVLCLGNTKPRLAF